MSQKLRLNWTLHIIGYRYRISIVERFLEVCKGWSIRDFSPV